jgi:hypothetical protein
MDSTTQMQAAWERLISWQNALNDDQRLPALLNTMRSNLISMYVFLVQNRPLPFFLRFFMLPVYVVWDVPLMFGIYVKNDNT